MEYVNRSLALIKPRQLFFDWLINTPDWDIDLTLEQLRLDCTSLLIPEFEEPEEAVSYIDEMYERLFEMELASWVQEPEHWPQKRTLQMFWEWFDVELHSLVIDTVEEIFPDPAEIIH